MKQWNKIALFFIFFLGLFWASSAHAASATSTVSFHIRYQDTLAFEGSYILPDPTTVFIKDNKGIDRKATSTSVLASLLEIDKTADSFRVSDLGFFESFDSFLINCIEITAKTVNACFDWQYAVNGVLPSVGADKYLLKTGDEVWLFFGQSHRVLLDKSTVFIGETIKVIANSYHYQTNIWLPLSSVTVGITKTNPDNPFSPIVLATSTVNNLGEAAFTLAAVGEYKVGIAEDFYFPSVTLIVTEPPKGGGGFAPLSHSTISREKAIQFLGARQYPDGSFGAPLYTDWVAVAFGAYEGENPARERLKEYLLADPSPGTLLTDYERRAMALEALGINPSNSTKTNYIQKIIGQFDGTQFGSQELFNDDIFALFPLLHAGVSPNDQRIQKTIAFILSKQKPDGSWIGADITAAAIQALLLTPSIEGVSPALSKARGYLKNIQEAGGGFEGNVFSTSWAIQAIRALGEHEEDWEKGVKTPGDYLFGNQAGDGGLPLLGDANMRIWATAYAIPASLQKTWDEILVHFSFEPPIGGITGVEPVKPVEYATTTIPLFELPQTATSTPPLSLPPQIPIPSASQPLGQNQVIPPPSKTLALSSLPLSQKETALPQKEEERQLFQETTPLPLQASPISPVLKTVAKEVFFAGGALLLIFIAYLIIQFVILL
ncbi:MAG: DUF4430 domain-containing protein [Candidatus Portnoybacteria bacterium]|nr:DUF4430 domain-containing protein [Candidatus Portnoybacteria bacterium]